MTSFDETLAASRRLDQHLKDAIMPITDGKPLVSIKDLVADIAAAKDEFRFGLQRELTDMAKEIRANGQASIRKVQDERRAVRNEFSELLGNEIELVDDTKSDDQSGS